MQFFRLSRWIWGLLLLPWIVEANPWPTDFLPDGVDARTLISDSDAPMSLRLDGIETLMQSDVSGAEEYLKELKPLMESESGVVQGRAAFLSAYLNARKQLVLENSDIETLKKTLFSAVSAPWETRGYLYLGDLAHENGLFTTALDFHQKALNMFRAVDKKDWEIICLLRIASDYVERDLVQEGEEAAEEALGLAESLKNPAYEAWSSYLLAEIEQVEHEFDDALKFIHQAEDGFRTQSDVRGLVDAQLLHSSLLVDLAKYNDAEEVCRQLLQTTKSLNDDSLRDRILATRANAVLLQGRRVEAEQIVQRIVKLDNLSVREKADICLLFAKMDLLSEIPHKTLEYLGYLDGSVWDNLDYARKAGYHGLIADYYASQGKYEQAYEHYKELFHNAQRDLRLQDQREIEHLRSLHEIRQQEEELKRLNAENQLAQLKIQNHRIMRNSIATVVILLLLFLNIFYRRWANTKQRNKELNAILEDAERARRAADKANEAKSSFLANMSHEIRTPMNGVIGMTDLLSRTSLNELQREYVELIKSSGSHLMTLINDILDISKINAGKLELDHINFKTEDVINHSIELNRRKSREKDLELITDISSQVPRELIGDPIRLGQILFNLIGNAVKFTNRGHIKLGMDFVYSTKETGVLSLDVSDTGIGIPEERRREIFHAFTQVDTSTTRKFGGSGLGLTICHNLCRLMGGHITLESEVNKGTTFHVRIPFRLQPETGCIDDTKDVSLTEEMEEESPLVVHDDIRILLAEDNLINRQVVLLYLEELGYDADVAETGNETVAQAMENQYDVVFMDVNMPELDGLEATRKIRKTLPDGFKQPMIIGLSASASSEDLRIGKEAGMDDYITKPITYDQLEECIEHLVQAKA